MLDRNSKKPLFMQISEELEKEIEKKSPNSKIDSEPRLVKKYGVSRGTLNKAIENLVYEGKLFRIPKKGTYVSPKKIQRSFDKLPSHSEDIKKRGLKPGALLLELARVVSNRKICNLLNLKEESIVWKVKRIRTADDKPIILSTSYLPTELFPELTREEVLDSLYYTLEKKYGNRPTWAHDIYSAINADSIVASLLNVKLNTALLFLERLSYSTQGRPLEYGFSYIRGDMYEIHVDINRPSLVKEKSFGIKGQINSRNINNG